MNTNFLFAQGTDFLRETGKMYSVYAVVLVLILAIFGYLIYLDKKISRIEKNIKDE